MAYKKATTEVNNLALMIKRYREGKGSNPLYNGQKPMADYIERLTAAIDDLRGLSSGKQPFYDYLAMDIETDVASAAPGKEREILLQYQKILTEPMPLDSRGMLPEDSAAYVVTILGKPEGADISASVSWLEQMYGFTAGGQNYDFFQSVTELFATQYYLFVEVCEMWNKTIEPYRDKYPDLTAAKHQPGEDKAPLIQITPEAIDGLKPYFVATFKGMGKNPDRFNEKLIPALKRCQTKKDIAALFYACYLSADMVRDMRPGSWNKWASVVCNLFSIDRLPYKPGELPPPDYDVKYYWLQPPKYRR